MLGPVLRHVGQTDATVWVETDLPCLVEILGRQEQTWTVAGHHYALVVITDLPVGSDTSYQVRLDGDRVWPLPDDPRPAPSIRTIAADAEIRIAFGSCRYARADEVADDPHFDPDALACLARDLPRHRAGQLAGRAAAARRPGVRRRDHAADPAADPAAARHHHRAEGAGRRLRGIHLAVCRILDGPGRRAGCCPRCPPR